MKINVEFDLTPEEFRQALGLPDVEAFQKDLLDRIQKQMESGVEGYDPMSLMQPFLQQQGLPQGLTQGLSQGMASFGSYQQMMLDMLRKAASGQQGDNNPGGKEGKAGKKEDVKREKGEEGKSESSRASSRGTGSSTASARSRRQREE